MSEYANVKVVSDGTPMGTHVEVDGKVLPVSSLKIEIDANPNTLGKLTLVVDAVPLELEARAVERVFDITP